MAGFVLGAGEGRAYGFHGATVLAAQAIAAGLVDEYQLFIVPAVVGGGTRAPWRTRSG